MTASTTQRSAKILIANRGEIALRVVRAAREDGRVSVAVYSDQDLNSRYVQEADEAYSLQGASAADTYLDQEKILAIAAKSGADAIHPGYGFLAENPTFARAVRDAGLIWLGPSPDAIEALGDKITARETATKLGVPTVPGSDGALTGRDEVERFIEKHGFPVVIKASDGGGGRGITVMQQPADLNHFFAGRSDDSLGNMFIERYVARARHVETQCGRDTHGNFFVYSTRDCSIQRRHQKLIEEAPAPFLTAEVEKVLTDASRALFEGVDYIGLGTVEFLLEGDSAYFLEVNPRLQVEHTVTEEVTGTDLVQQQFLIADGAPIAAPAPVRGHAIELRITSEDPQNDFTPTTGTLTSVTWPGGPGIRVDASVEDGDEISLEYDSMIAKVVVLAPTRAHAIARAKRAIRETHLEGLATPLKLYDYLLGREEFASEESLSVYTKWLENEVLSDPEALSDALGDDSAGSAVAGPAVAASGGSGATSATAATTAAGTASAKRISFPIEIDGRRHQITIPEGVFGSAAAPTQKPKPSQPLRSQRDTARAGAVEAVDGLAITSPMQAIVVRVTIEVGQAVLEGDLVAVLESMKMEKYVHAHRSGVVENIAIATGTNVTAGQVLIQLAEHAAENQ